MPVWGSHMRNRNLISLLALSLSLAAGCDTSTDSPAPPPSVEAQLGTPFTLAPGQTAVFAEENLTVTFASGVEDGRCPVDIECLVAGQASMAVLARSNDRIALMLNLTVPADAVGVAYGDFRVHAEDLSPYPQSGVTVPPEDFRLRLLVDRP